MKSTAFVSYICDQVLPHRSEIGQAEGSEQKLDIFKLLAELSTNTGPLDPALDRIQIVYDTLLVIITYIEINSTLNFNLEFTFCRNTCLFHHQ